MAAEGSAGRRALMGVCEGGLIHSSTWSDSGDESSREYQPVPEIAGLRLLPDGYCAPNRPSFTDSKMGTRSVAYLHQYQMAPATRPHYMPDLTVDRVREMHLEHQVWDPGQGWLWAGFECPKVVPRLGVEMTVKEVKAVEPASLRWRGVVSLTLQVAVKETLGISVQDVRDADKLYDAWPHEGKVELASGCDDPVQFLLNAFGVQLYNIIVDDKDFPHEICGPSSFASLSLEDDQSGSLSGTWEFSGPFHCNVDLRHFPFDLCYWDALLSFKGWSPGVVYEGWSTLRNIGDFQLFALHGIPRAGQNKWRPYICEQNVVPNYGRHGEGFVYCRFHTRRLFGQVMSTVIIPTALVVVLSTLGILKASGQMSNEGVAESIDAVGFISTALLTVVAMKFAYADNLPKSMGSATYLDIYMLTCIFILAVSMVVVCVVPEDDLDSTRAPVVFLLLVILVHVAFFITAAVAYMIRLPSGNKIYDVPHEHDLDTETDQHLRIGFISRADAISAGFRTHE